MCSSSTNIKERVIALLKEYPALKRKIALLQYERSHATRVSEQEMIDGMTFAHPVDDLISHTGHISDKTMQIALRFRGECDRLNVESLTEILQELEHLEARLDKLEFYVSQLDPKPAEIIRKHYFEERTWRELQEDLHMTPRTLMRYRDMGVAALAEMFHFLERVTSGAGQ